jgi:hypothetical protein
MLMQNIAPLLVFCIVSFHCTYMKMWVKVKSVYNLTITDEEKGALVEMLETCEENSGIEL